jgi:hypothetical protein
MAGGTHTKTLQISIAHYRLTSFRATYLSFDETGCNLWHRNSSFEWMWRREKMEVYAQKLSIHAPLLIID